MEFAPLEIDRLRSTGSLAPCARACAVGLWEGRRRGVCTAFLAKLRKSGRSTKRVARQASRLASLRVLGPRACPGPPTPPPALPSRLAR